MAIDNILEVTEGIQTQSADEQLAYQITTTNWGTAPTSATAVVWDLTAGETNVTPTSMPGTATVSGNIITLPLLKSLTENHMYRVETKFVSSGNTWECYFRVKCPF